MDFEVKNHPANTRHEQEVDMAHILSMIPSAGMPPNTSECGRIANIFGFKRSQLNKLIDQIKDSCNSVIKSAGRDLDLMGCQKGLPRQERTANLAIQIMQEPAYRKQLFLAHQQWVRSTTRRRNKRPPVMEFELIKRWNPRWDLYECEHDDLVYKGMIEGLRDGQLALIPSFSAGFFDNIESTALRAMLVYLTDELIMEAASASELDEERQSDLGGALYAIASLAETPGILVAFSMNFPEVVSGMLLSMDDESYLESVNHNMPDDVLRRMRLNKLITRAFHPLMILKHRACLDELGTMRVLMNDIETSILELGDHEVENFTELAATVKKKIIDLASDFTTVGAKLNIIPLHERYKHWEELLEHKIMEQASPERSRLVAALINEAEQVGKSVSEICTLFLDIAARRDEIFQDSSNWAEQSKLLMEASQELESAKERFETLAEEVGAFEPFTLKLVTHELEVEVEQDITEIDKLERMLANAITAKTKMETQIKDANSRITELRQENAEIKTQMDALKLSLSDQPTVCTDTDAEVKALLEGLAVSKGNAHDVMNTLNALYPDRVLILDSAFKAAESQLSSISAGALMTRLKALITDGLDMIRESGQIISCKDLVPGEVAVQESETVRTRSKFTNMRTFPYNGSKHTFFPHLRVGHTHRVYFDYMPDDSQRIVIAYVGQHLPSDKSSTV